MTYQFRPARRSEAKPLIGLYSESGAGKTYSALILARGFVGPQGRIGMIETESGRGEAYAEPSEYPEIGGYQVLPIRENFSPRTYGEAISAAEKVKLDALIIDSASHEWEGAGGVLAMAAINQEQGKKGPLVWQKPKLEHQRHFMLRFMQTSIPLVILCMRAKYPMREVPKPGGGADEKVWLRSEQLHPKQADDILFEMFVHGWISHGDHAFHATKCTAKSLQAVFVDGRPVSLETGRQLAAWARGDASERQPESTLERARRAAAQGKDAFLVWWQGEGRGERDAVRAYLDELKHTAEQADAREPMGEEDPFGLPHETEDPFAAEATAQRDAEQEARHGSAGDAETQAASPAAEDDAPQDPQAPEHEPAAPAGDDEPPVQAGQPVSDRMPPDGWPLVDYDGVIVKSYKRPGNWLGALEAEVKREAGTGNPELCAAWIEANAEVARRIAAANPAGFAEGWERVRAYAGQASTTQQALAV